MFRLFFVIALVLLPHKVMAQELQKFMMPQGGLQIALVAGVQSPVALQITSSTAITSCAEVGPIESAISLDRNFVDIETGGYTITQKQRGTCAAGTKFARTTIDLPPEEFRQSEVTQLRLWSGPMMDAYGVTVTDSEFTLTPPNRIRFFKPASGGSLTFALSGSPQTSDDMKSFEETVKMKASDMATSDEKMVIVRVDGYPDADVEAQLTTLMESRGLHATEALQKNAGATSMIKAIDTGGQFAMQARYNGPVILGRIGSHNGSDQAATGGPANQTFDVYVTLP